jgi:hypothetical protein
MTTIPNTNPIVKKCSKKTLESLPVTYYFLTLQSEAREAGWTETPIQYPFYCKLYQTKYMYIVPNFKPILRP